MSGEVLGNCLGHVVSVAITGSNHGTVFSYGPAPVAAAPVVPTAAEAENALLRGELADMKALLAQLVAAAKPVDEPATATAAVTGDVPALTPAEKSAATKAANKAAAEAAAAAGA